MKKKWSASVNKWNSRDWLEFFPYFNCFLYKVEERFVGFVSFWFDAPVKRVFLSHNLGFFWCWIQMKYSIMKRTLCLSWFGRSQSSFVPLEWLVCSYHSTFSRINFLWLNRQQLVRRIWATANIPLYQAHWLEWKEPAENCLIIIFLPL